MVGSWKDNMTTLQKMHIYSFTAEWSERDCISGSCECTYMYMCIVWMPVAVSLHGCWTLGLEQSCAKVHVYIHVHVCAQVVHCVECTYVQYILNIEISQLLLWTWNDERFSFLTTSLGKKLISPTFPTRCSSRNIAKMCSYKVKLSRKRTFHHFMH